MLFIKRKFTKEHFYCLFLVLILLTASFMRFYRIREYMTFLGDEGRDVLIVKRILLDHKFTLLGPITSVGSIYMGPIYYYFMAPFLLLWKFDPVGPSVMVALFGVLTVYLIFKLCSDYFHQSIGLISAFLYAISPMPVIYGRSSWNPNIVPFFSLLLVYSLLNTFIKKKYLWLAIGGLSLGVMIQLHYVTFMFFLIIPSIFIYFRQKIPVKYILLSAISFIAAYSPFILFELRHGFVNTTGAFRFIFQQKHAEGSGFMDVISTVQDVFVRIFWRLVVVENAEFTKLFICALFLIIGIYYWKKMKMFRENKALTVILIWLFIGILSYALYRGIIYDYYFGSLFSLPYILTGIFIFILWKFSLFGRFMTSLILIALVFFSIIHSPLMIEPNNMLRNTMEISKFVFDKTKNKPYNFALIAGKNSDHAYRYFLELWGNPPKVIENPGVDPKRNTVSEDLYIVCEEKICSPLGHPLWEIAGFGQAEIIDNWKVSTAQVFHLAHIKEKI